MKHFNVLAFKIYDFFYNKFASESHKNKVLINFLEDEISKYPHLCIQKPTNWPRHKKYNLTDIQMHRFQRKREQESFEGMNFPLLIHNIHFADDEHIRQIFQSIVNVLEWFAENMSSKPGAGYVLEPIWNDAWDPLRFWSVVSEVFFIKHIATQGFQIDGFERKIPNSSKSADIKATFQNRSVWIDIEANTIEPFQGSSDQFRQFISRRAIAKMTSKFKNLPASETGMVASIYRVTNRTNLDCFSRYKEATSPVPGPSLNVAASIFWLIQGRLEGSDGPFGLQLVNNTTSIHPR